MEIPQSLCKNIYTKFLKDQAHTPNITLESIFSTDDSFRTFVWKSPDNSTWKILFLKKFPCNTKIGQLHLSFWVEQDVSRLDISVNLIFAMKIWKATKHLQSYFSKNTFLNIRSFIDSSIKGNDMLKRSWIHQLQNNFNSSLIKVGPIKSD